MEPVTNPEKPRSKRRLLIASVLIIVLLVAGVAWFFYSLWLSSPEKALLDAIEYAKKTPGTYQVTMGDRADMQVKTDGKLIAFSGSIDDSKVEGVVDGMDVYVKSSQPQEFITMFTPESGYLAAGTAVQNLLKSYAASLSDKWVKININDFQRSSPEVVYAQCGLEMFSTLSKHGELTAKLGDVYISNQFISSQAAGSSADEQTYTYTIDTTKLKAFLDGLVESEVGETTTSCGYVPAALGDQGKNLSFTASIHKPQHYIRHLTTNNGDKEGLTLKADYSARPTIAVPQGALTFQEITNQIFTLFLNDR